MDYTKETEAHCCFCVAFEALTFEILRVSIYSAGVVVNVKPDLGHSIVFYSLSLCQMFSVYVMCGAQNKDAVRLTLEQIDVVRRMCTEYQEFELVTSAQGRVHPLKAVKTARTAPCAALHCLSICPCRAEKC